MLYLTEQRAARVPGAAVYPAAAVPGAEHVLGDVVVLVHAHTVAHRHYRHLQSGGGIKTSIVEISI